MAFFSKLFNPAFGYVRAAFAIVVGLVLVIWPGVSLELIIKGIGCALMLLALVLIMMALFGRAQKASQAKALMIANAIVNLAFGIILFTMPYLFVKIFMVILGIALAIFGAGQLANLISAKTSHFTVSWVLFILPALTMIFGIVLLFNTKAVVEVMVALIGVACLVYGVSELSGTIALRRAFKKFSNGKEVEDVPYEEVK